MAGSVAFRVDATDFSRLGRNLHNLPADLKRNAFWAASKRVGQMARTRIVRDVAKMINVPQKAVRDRMKVSAGTDGSTTIVIRSKWIPLYELGARQTRTGVTVKLRGSYAHAFIARMNSGHAGVFRREGAGSPRLPIHEQFGPNPANAVNRKANEYQAILAQMAEENMLPRLLHELDYRLSRMNVR